MFREQVRTYEQTMNGRCEIGSCQLRGKGNGAKRQMIARNISQTNLSLVSNTLESMTLKKGRVRKQVSRLGPYTVPVGPPVPPHPSALGILAPSARGQIVGQVSKELDCLDSLRRMRASNKPAVCGKRNQPSIGRPTAVRLS